MFSFWALAAKLFGVQKRDWYRWTRVSILFLMSYHSVRFVRNFGRNPKVAILFEFLFENGWELKSVGAILILSSTIGIISTIEKIFSNGRNLLKIQKIDQKIAKNH